VHQPTAFEWSEEYFLVLMDGLYEREADEHVIDSFLALVTLTAAAEVCQTHSQPGVRVRVRVRDVLFLDMAFYFGCLLIVVSLRHICIFTFCS
jgi:hypothetical protein